MTSIIGSIFSDTTDGSADQTIAYNSAAGAAVAAQAYLTAALTSTTPELRRLYSEYCSQLVMGHEAMMGLMINNNWLSPYDAPEKQLHSVIQQSSPAMKKQH